MDFKSSTIYNWFMQNYGFLLHPSRIEKAELNLTEEKSTPATNKVAIRIKEDKNWQILAVIEYRNYEPFEPLNVTLNQSIITDHKSTPGYSIDQETSILGRDYNNLVAQKRFLTAAINEFIVTKGNEESVLFNYLTATLARVEYVINYLGEEVDKITS